MLNNNETTTNNDTIDSVEVTRRVGRPRKTALSGRDPVHNYIITTVLPENQYLTWSNPRFVDIGKSRGTGSYIVFEVTFVTTDNHAYMATYNVVGLAEKHNGRYDMSISADGKRLVGNGYVLSRSSGFGTLMTALSNTVFPIHLLTGDVSKLDGLGGYHISLRTRDGSVLVPTTILQLPNHAIYNKYRKELGMRRQVKTIKDK